MFNKKILEICMYKNGKFLTSNTRPTFVVENVLYFLVIPL